MQHWQMKELAPGDWVFGVETRARGRVVRRLATGLWVRWGIGVDEHLPWSAHRQLSLSPVHRGGVTADDPPEEEQRRILREIQKLQAHKRARCERGDVSVHERQPRPAKELDDDDE